MTVPNPQPTPPPNPVVPVNVPRRAPVGGTDYRRPSTPHRRENDIRAAATRLMREMGHKCSDNADYFGGYECVCGGSSWSNRDSDPVGGACSIGWRDAEVAAAREAELRAHFEEHLEMAYQMAKDTAGALVKRKAEVAERDATITTLQAERDHFSTLYVEASEALTPALGTEPDDEVGNGLVADVTVLVDRYTTLQARIARVQAVVDDHGTDMNRGEILADWPEFERGAVVAVLREMVALDKHLCAGDLERLADEIEGAE